MSRCALPRGENLKSCGIDFVTCRGFEIVPDLSAVSIHGRFVPFAVHTMQIPIQPARDSLQSVRVRVGGKRAKQMLLDSAESR